ncbi:MAG: hypothetical protein M3Z05_15475 [Gemmatimonadota bacterium]|nr:hypothetical protein [Gemmatimonadota bacterium]
MSEGLQLPAPPSPLRLTCHGTHPNPFTRRHGVGARCHRFLGYVPGVRRFVTVAAIAPSEPDGMVWVRCPKCRTWNVFELVPPHS